MLRDFICHTIPVIGRNNRYALTSNKKHNAVSMHIRYEYTIIIIIITLKKYVILLISEEYGPVIYAVMASVRGPVKNVHTTRLVYRSVVHYKRYDTSL